MTPIAPEVCAQSKTCTKCGETKPLDGFNRHAINKTDGRRPECRDCQKARMSVYCVRARKKRSDYNRAYFQANKARILEKNKRWVAENIETNRAYQRKAMAKRLSTPAGKLNARVRDGIRKCIGDAKARRSSFKLLGYTVHELKSHLEAQFLPGMTWENYGPVWHIDHIIPLSAFNFESAEDYDFKRAWALTNLQPLFAFDNLSKHAKLDAPFQPSLLLP